jgi:hypothetical protein
MDYYNIRVNVALWLVELKHDVQRLGRVRSIVTPSNLLASHHGGDDVGGAVDGAWRA